MLGPKVHLNAFYMYIFRSSVRTNNTRNTVQLQSTFCEVFTYNYRIIVCFSHFQPKHLPRVSVDTTVYRKTERFQFILAVNVPRKNWTRVYVFPSAKAVSFSAIYSFFVQYMQQLKYFPLRDANTLYH